MLLAGKVVSIAASTRSLGGLVARPFSHLPSATGPAALRIEATDGGENRGAGPDRIDVARDGAIVTHVRPTGVAKLDRQDGVLRAWWPGADAVPVEDRAKPFLLALAVWLADCGLTVAHAGCVARDGRALLFVGPAGSGKSTAALACTARGFAFLGDDHVAVAVDPGGPVAHSLYGTARLDRPTLAANSFLACCGPVLEAGDEKPVLVLAESAATLSAAARIVAVAVVGRGGNSVRPISRAASLRGLAPSSLLRMPLGGQAFRQLAELAAAVPAVAIRASSPGAVPALADRVLEEA